MTTRLALALAFTPCALMAQLQLYVIKGGSETRVTGLYDLGSAATGGSLDTAFRLKNSSASTVTLERLTVAGTGFSLQGVPHLPTGLLAGAVVDFTVRFQPVVQGGYSAYLWMNGDYVLLLGTGEAGAVLLLNNTLLSSSSTVDFGSLEIGATATKQFVLENRTPVAVRVEQLSVSGTGFHGPIGITPPLALAPGTSTPFDVVWEPHATGTAEGILTVGPITIHLRGTAISPPLPFPDIEINPVTPTCGQQAKLAIRFAAASQASGTGQLTMEFQGSADASIGFLSPAGRTATFTVQPGDSVARFGTRTDIDFQTGTTAGTIIFTAELGGMTERVTLQLAASPVSFDTATGIRRASSLEVTLTGFDNSRSAGPISFTFLGRSGQTLGGGAISVNLANQFTQLFSGSDAGGMFTLRAVFPATGDTSQIDSVDVELSNSVGATRRNVKMTE